MGNNEHRQISRDSLFVMAELRVDGVEGDHRVRIRNLSPGGLMAEGNIKVARGQIAWVQLRNIGWVEGTVAWIQENRFGVAFRDEIDARLARLPAPPPQEGDLLVNRPAYYIAPGSEGSDQQFRKI